ncbi:MAG: hypothetical protein HC831_17905 [Chloroflexia bacterium]|nr:hypothetical protein [Chloroflexia bacterium]
MKNFPHQINNLGTLLEALRIAKINFADTSTPLTDYDYGERILRANLRDYRDKNLTIDEYLAQQRTLRASDRSYETTPRDLKFFFRLLGFIVLYPDQRVHLTPLGIQLLNEPDANNRILIWKTAFLLIGLEGRDGEISHPYRILLKIVNTFAGIETKKLMLALEAENDSDEEFERISNLSQLPLAQIIEDTGTTSSMAANAVKILPGIAEQLGDIERRGNNAYPIGQLVITEDEITTEEQPERRARSEFRQTNAGEIARDPILNTISSVTVDYAEAIRIRQRRLAEHQEIVRLLASINESCGFQLYEGKFDCLAIKDNTALLYEVKTILSSASDEEKQTVKGVGQLKYYKFSIVIRQMRQTNIKEVIVFSSRPETGIIEFCSAENISVIWRVGEAFQIFNVRTNADEVFNPDNLL